MSTAFLDAWPHMHLFRHPRDSPPFVASGIHRYVHLFDLLGGSYRPPPSDIIPIWSVAFAPGRAFGTYAIHLAEACRLTGYSLDWRPPLRKAPSKGYQMRPTWASNLIIIRSSLPPTESRKGKPPGRKSVRLSIYIYPTSYAAHLGRFRRIAPPAGSLSLYDGIQSAKAIVGIREISDGHIRSTL